MGAPDTDNAFAGAMILAEMGYDLRRLRTTVQQLGGVKRPREHWP